MASSAKLAPVMLALTFLGVLVGVFASQPIKEFVQDRPAPSPAVPTIKLPPVPEEVAKPHLSRAEKECERVLDEHLHAINTFFADSKKNTRPFADEALSWASKWRLIVDYVPFTGGGRHETFVRGKFEEYVFKPSQLEDAVRQVVASYLKHVESIEGEMLVSIRADVADFPSTYVISQIEVSKLRASYDEALSKAMEATASNLRTDIASELVSIITGGVLAQVAVRLGTSTAILGVGAASSWATLGVGFVVGLIVDQIISWVWDWYADPKGELAAELNGKLDEINRLIVDGSDDVQGLRERLRAFAEERATVRNRAVMAILQQQ
jgi:hypothetical protein